MKKIYCTLLVCLLNYGSEAFNLSKPSVYVVTPSSRSHQENEARSAPFYYHNWMRRMDSPNSTTTTTPKVKTPDLIFAEFESEHGNDMKKSIRKLLEQERVASKTSTTTSQPIFVPEDDSDSEKQNMFGVPKQEDATKSEVDMTDYFALYNNLYGDVKNNHVPRDPSPVFLPATTSTTSTTTTTTTTPEPNNVENIWHIIDNEKRNQYFDKWEEVTLNTNSDGEVKQQDNDGKNTENKQNGDHNVEDFALPGFGTHPGSGGENESRAIRTEPNIQFPYVSLKPFQMKNINVFSNSKKGNNMFNLDDFKEVNHPVRGEIQDAVPMHQPVDRYNPAQPYLPYGGKSKQSSPSSPPSKTVANLVPPPPPPPKPTGDDFPAPSSYESFPPYPPAVVATPPPSPPAMNPSVSVYKPPSDSSDAAVPDSPMADNTDDSPMDLGYRYKPSSFVPTLPPLSKPFNGYSYNKPVSAADTPPTMDMGGYTYSKPAITLDSPPTMDMGGYYNKPQESPPLPDDKPDYHQYSSDDHPSHSYDHPGPPPSYHHDNDYPELIFNKPHGTKGESDMKENDMGMMPPPPPADMKPGMDSGPPMDDSGFPADFPGDFKFHHDFDDHDFHHYHYHTTTTTTTTEMPRVNRYSYYYLGKKLYYLPLYFSVYFIIYVGALIIKAVLRHKIVYPNSWRPNDTTASFFSKRSVDSWDLSYENLHEVTGRVTKAIAEAAEKYVNENAKTK